MLTSMPLPTTRFPLREHDSDSEEECNTGPHIYGHRVITGHRLERPVSPSIRAGSIHGGAIQTPGYSSPPTRFNLLPSRISVLEGAMQVEGLRQGHRPAAQGSLLVSRISSLPS